MIVIHIVKGFVIVNKAEIDVFLELSFFFAGSGATEEGLTSRGGRHLRLPLHTCNAACNRNRLPGPGKASNLHSHLTWMIIDPRAASVYRWEL